MRSEQEVRQRLKELEDMSLLKKFFYPYGVYKPVVETLKWFLQKSKKPKYVRKRQWYHTIKCIDCKKTKKTPYKELCPACYNRARRKK